jgi:rhodanese-related sulfurtransferase
MAVQDEPVGAYLICANPFAALAVMDPATPVVSVNIPLYFIRLKINALDKNTQYVVCCDTGRRSSAAAYILSERGFEAYVLKGGLAASEAARSRSG